MKTVNNFSYETPIKFNIKLLKDAVMEMQESEGFTKTAKNNAMSLFNKLYKLSFGSDEFTTTMVGESKGNTCRVYYKPSYTQYPKPVRKGIVPVKEGNMFVYFDLKAAEYILNCILAGDDRTVESYMKGEDPYMVYSELFPAGTDRKVMKEALIGNMYGLSPFTLAKRANVSEDRAKFILAQLNRNMPAQAALKHRILSATRALNGYICAAGLDSKTELKVADVDPSVGYSENRALSVYTQSALGVYMQSLLERLATQFTLIQVFDSVLIEVGADTDVNDLVYAVKDLISPFRAEIGFGRTFYEAMQDAKEYE